MARIAIELRNVRKQRRTKTIGPLNLNLPEGHIIALVGQNGSGKSTLMQLLVQLIHPGEGEIEWFGNKYREAIPLQLRQSMVYVPEVSLSEESGWTVEEAAGFRRYWYPRWDHDFFLKLLDQFEVPRDSKLGKMSKGERRKFEIAAALAPKPKLLLLDEPSSGLDPFAWKLMIEVLHKYMNEHEATILISTHIVEEVRKLADYIVLMHRGMVLGMAEKDSLYGQWSEVWVGADSEEEIKELAAEFPDALHWSMDTAGVASFIAEDFHRIEKRLHDLGVKLIKSRSLELDEILSLWTEGYVPELVDLKRGD
ncbi:ATP-binding cassette domain-containing protein [Paenibacillus sp. sgz500958]|uniref:ATP-binding cassette domain-containing protein n=1 Tax=Paenibacillus sp. sgz500958 TaxID=3242475 RepID=UPI0036D300CD